MSSIAPVLKQLFEAYPSNKATEGTVAMYVKLLRDIPAAELQVVVDQAVCDCTYLPTIAEIRSRWHKLTRPAGAMSAAEAWGMVTAEIRRVGSWGTPCFEHPQVAHVVRAIGWQELCMSENQMADRAHFMRMFEQVAGREEEVARLLPSSRALLESRGAVGDVVKRLADGKRTAAGRVGA